MPDPFRTERDGVVLFVRLTPRAAADTIGGTEHDAAGRPHLTAKVRAVPEKGLANAALERLVANWLNVAKSEVAVVAGDTARLKTLRIRGDPAQLAVRIRDRLA